MNITGKTAVEFLKSYPDLVSLHKKDNKDKFWSYKVLHGRHSEFAFDPNTKTKLIVRFDQCPPQLPGVGNIIDIRNASVSTSLKRVFSGREHVAKYKATISDEKTLIEVIKLLK